MSVHYIVTDRPTNHQAYLNVAYTKDELRRFSDHILKEISNFHFYEYKNKEDAINYLDSIYATGVRTIKQDLKNPYQYLSYKEILVLAKKRNLIISENYQELINSLIEDDTKTNSEFNIKILSKQLFQITDPVELMLYGAVYGISIVEYDFMTAKQLIYILMTMPKLKNYNDPPIIQQAYYERISTDIKRQALYIYHPMAVDFEYLNDAEINETFRNGYIAPRYEIYLERMERSKKIWQMQEWLRDKFLMQVYKTTDVIFIVANSEWSEFEKKLYEKLDVEKMGEKLGMIFPLSQNLRSVNRIEYFFENYLEYNNINTMKSDIFTQISNGTVKKYLCNLTDGAILNNIAFVHYDNRKNLIEKIYNLINGTITFFVKDDENKDDKILHLCYGTFSQYVIYSNVQLYSSFFRHKKFIKPGTNNELFTIWQVNELMYILYYYREICTDLLMLIGSKINNRN